MIGVAEDAPIQVIDSAYRRQALIWHPDKAGPDGQEKLQQLAEAVALLRDAIGIMMEQPGNHTLCMPDDGSESKSGGKDKSRISVLPTICADGTFVKPTIVMFKGVADPKRKSTRTLAHEFEIRAPDKKGNQYPPASEIYLMCNKTAYQTEKVTATYFRKIHKHRNWEVRGANGQSDSQVDNCFLADDFSAYKSSNGEVKKIAKDVCKSDLLLLDGGLTPVGQPLDKLIQKIIKGNYRQQYDEYAIDADEDDKGNIPAPSRQLCAQWVANAINNIEPEVIIRSFIHCGLAFPSDYPGMEFPANCAGLSAEELFADRPEVLHRYQIGAATDEEDILTLEAHAQRKGLQLIEQG